MITKQIAVELSHGKTLTHATLKDSMGNPVKCRVTGKCQVWKTRPTEFKLPVKYGLYDSFYITESDAVEWSVI